MSVLSILAGALNPVSIIETVKDENLKRKLEGFGVSLLWSQYITLLYELGNAVQGKLFVGLLAPVFRMLAASAYKLVQQQNIQKVMELSVSKALTEDTALLDKITFASLVEEKGKA
jgi:hypothetical protein